ncbi:MAG: UbiA family prenyltransferase [Alphaproteobacteria bacterium]
MAKILAVNHPRPHEALPLAVDLDGTLVRSDLFVIGMLSFLWRAPWRVFQLIGWLVQGFAFAKARVAEAAPIEPSRVAYNEAFLAWLQEQRRSGRRLILATAANARVASAIAAHLNIFDDVVASDERINLKGAHKADRLRSLFPNGFAYAGNSGADIAVWRAAKAAIVVSAPRTIERSAGKYTEIEKVFPRSAGAPAWKALRPHQWSKNLLVLAPLLLGEPSLEPAAWGAALLATLALSLVASSVYIVNDLADLEADRQHPRKRHRPIASGALSAPAGLALALFCFTAGMALSALAHCLPLVGAYFVVSCAYTFWLKKISLLDVFVLAGLYMLRVLVGGEASGFAASDWLIAFCGFFFLSLALVKRVVELRSNPIEYARAPRRDYALIDAPTLETMGLASGFASCVVLALYLHSSIVMARFSEPLYLWALPTCVAFWLCRVWLLAKRGLVHDDPVVFALRDRTSFVVAGIVGVAFAAAAMLPGTGLVMFR